MPKPETSYPERGHQRGARSRELLRPVLRTGAGRRARRELMAVELLVRDLASFDHPSWLYRSRGNFPQPAAHRRASRAVSGRDVALCRRLVGAYDLAQSDAPPPSGVWSHDIFQDRQRGLVQALERGDAAGLAGLLASMFQSDAVLGMACGSLGVAAVSRLGGKFSSLVTLSKLVALSESQGAARAESPEQGAVGLAFAGGVETLLASTEVSLGVSLDFPNVGAAYGVQVAGRLITRDTPDQVYAAARLRAAICSYLTDREQPLQVVEIGAGYGGMAYWLLQMIDLRYVIVDLPVINVLQGYFLAQALGDSEVSFYGEPPARVTIAPTHTLASVSLPFDVLANKDSMPEIPETALIDYLSWARTGCNGIFYSYNQEAAAPYDGTPQNVVPEVLSRVGGFDRVRRDASWLRRGYVEEVYTPSAASFTSAQTPLARPG